MTQQHDGPDDPKSQTPRQTSGRSPAQESHRLAQARRRKRRVAVKHALSERDGAQRYELNQRKMRRGTSGGEGRAHPSEFDASGFSVRQPISSLVRRVGWLIDG
jgi:hypothetical protein